jgi:hypothetical protein
VCAFASVLLCTLSNVRATFIEYAVILLGLLRLSGYASESSGMAVGGERANDSS